MWAQVDIEFRPEEEVGGKTRPFFITDLKPIQLAAFSLDDYRAGRRELTTDEWLDLLIRSLGFEPSSLNRREKLLMLMRLVPMAQRNYNLVELGPRGTGKSYVYRELSPYSILISGGMRIPAMSSIDSGHVVHPRDRSGASIDIIQSGGRHGQGRTELAL